MQRRSVTVVILMLILCLLISCGVRTMQRAAAPMSRTQGQVTTSLTALPEDLKSVKLLAKTNSIVLRAVRDSGEGTYEVRPVSGAYRRMVSPLAGDWDVLAMTPTPDGGLWTVITSEARCVLMKTSSAGALLTEQALEDIVPETIVCDSDGNVFLAADGQVQKRSPEGALLDVAELAGAKGAALHLAAQGNRVFVRYQPAGETGRYVEILPDLSLGAPFDACVAKGEVWPIGSFLPDYTVMEQDAVGLYACREDGTWETVCLWSELHLDGTIDRELMNDIQGCGVVAYEKNGVKYCLTLSAAKS